MSKKFKQRSYLYYQEIYLFLNIVSQLLNKMIEKSKKQWPEKILFTILSISNYC